MANEFKHKDPCSTLTQAEYIAACGDGHIFACQATGDIAYASSATVLSKLGKGAAGTILNMGGSCIPAWTASPSVTDLTISGGCITLTGAATDIDLIDNNASALSFDASGKAGIIDIVTTNCSEGVTMSGTLGVTGVLTATGGLAGGAICIGSSTITTTGLISGGSLDIDNVLINGTTIGHTCDTDLMTVADASLTIKGTVTVGVDDTGHDVQFFGAAAGAYMLWDEDANLLDIRGATAAGPGHLKLTTGELSVVANDVLGRIDFQAPLEADCSADARLVGASIAAVAGGTFADALNATDIVFYTGHSETAAEKFRFTSQGEIGIFTSCAPAYGTDGQVLTSTGAGTAVAWEDAAGGGLNSCADAIINNGYGIVLGNCEQLVAADNPGCVVAEFQMAGTANADTSMHLIRHSADAVGPQIRLAKSRHATIGSHTIVAACDVVGTIGFYGDDGVDLLSPVAEIRAVIDTFHQDRSCASSPAVAAPGANDMPGRLEFYTTPDGTQASVLAMTINNGGIITTPLQPSVFAYASSDDNNETGNGSSHTLIFDTEVTDQNADFDGTSTFTAPVTGVYHVAVVVKLQGVTTSASNAGMGMVASNRTTDFDFGGNIASLSGAVTHGYSACIDMDTADTLTITIFVSGEGSDVVDIDGAANPQTFLCVTKVT